MCFLPGRNTTYEDRQLPATARGAQDDVTSLETLISYPEQNE